MKIRLKNPEEIKALRRSGQIVATVLEATRQAIQPGITTAELAVVAREELDRLGGRPAFLGYLDFPDVICISVNNEIVHGVPGSRRIREGDLVGLDFGAIYNHMIADGAITVGVGRVEPDPERLLEGTRAALAAGVDQARAGNHVGDISAAVQAVLEKYDLGVIEDLAGHGVGHEVHEEPSVPNFGVAGKGPRLKAGMVLAIEPMATLGGPDIGVGSDQTTILTADGSWAAQQEHTVLVTPGAPEIMTKL